MLAQGSARHAEQAVGVHAEGADPRRDVPAARRLRGAHARPAGHARRARRLLRPRRHARFADGARAGHVQLGRNALARDGARDHAAVVGQPAAAVAERRHLGVRGAPRPRRLGPRHGHPVRARHRSRTGDQDSATSIPGSAARRRSISRTTRRRWWSSTFTTPTASGSCAR